LGGDHERLMRSLLGKVEITEEADQGGITRPHSFRKTSSIDVLALHDWADLDRSSHAGRRDPGSQVDRRVEVVRLVEEHSPTASFASMNGPSVVSVRPSCTRTVVAMSAGCS